MPFKRSLSAFVAVTIFSSSAASAAPQTVDPLIALSVLGTAESHAAVCGSGSCAGGSLAAASAGSAVATEAGAAQENASGTEVHGNMMPLWVALGAVLIGWAWIILDDNDNDGEVDLPISP